MAAAENGGNVCEEKKEIRDNKMGLSLVVKWAVVLFYGRLICIDKIDEGRACDYN